jgi:hypothetical protein
MTEIETKRRQEEAEQERRLRQLYREVFGTVAGQKVLFSILEDLGFFAEATAPDRVAIRNYGTFLIRKRIGLDDAEGVSQLIRTMLTHGK